MHALILSTSLGPKSRSKTMALALDAALKAKGMTTDFVCLSEHPLPLCDGASCYQDPKVTAMTARVQKADAVIVASPVYNFDLNAAAKNFVELTGPAWEDKVVGFLASAGGDGSFMAPMGFASQLMLDFRTPVIPRFVYGPPQLFENGQIVPKLQERIELLAAETVKYVKGLRG